ncbi:MAG: gliding motility-associated C-terminal domain-containing protein, partial [Flavipsychrobacter sp.]
YTVHSVLNGCQSTSPATVNVYVKWTPGTPTLTTNSPVCAGMGYNPNYLILNVSDTSSGVTYTWSGPNAFSVIDDPATTQTITNPPALDAGDYTVYATLNGCISAFTTSTVTIKPTPAPPAVSPNKFVYCQFDRATVLTATGDSLRWYSLPTGGVSATSVIPQDSIAGLYIYYATQTISGCQSQPASDTVLVKTKPFPPAAPSGFTYCQGDNASPIAAIGVNLLWYTSSTGGTGSPVTPTPSTATPGTFDYYVTQTVNGCESDRTHVVITVKPKPNPPSVTNPVVFCQGDVATPLTAGGVNLLWYNVSSGGIGSPIAPTPVTSYPDSAYYYVTQTVNGCQSDRAEIDVYTYYKPNAVIVGSAPYVCQYDTLSFSYYGNGTTDAAYNWTMPKGASIIGGYGQGPVVARFDSAGKYKVLLQVDNHGCKSPLTAYTVDVRLAPIVPVVMSNQVCQGDLVNVSTGTPNETIDNYNWDFAGAQVVYGATGAGPYGIRFDNQGMYVVKLIATSSQCPSAPILDTVYVHPLGDAHIQSASSTNICSGDSVHFTAESYNPSYLYQWLPTSYFQNITNMGDVYGYIDRTGFIKLKVTTEYGCTSEDSIQILAQACCDMFFPNAFTPNGDGKNDVFRPVSNGRQQIKDFRVVNRWGQTIFESVNQYAGWDGKLGGVPQDMGTYYYYIKYICANGKTYQQKGEILLVR